jgi:ech hydrogenase subunit A
LFLVAALGLMAAIYFYKVAGKVKPTWGPYLSGAQSPDNENEYIGPLRQSILPATSNYYLEKIFGESTISRWVNTAAMVLILLMLGGGL